jgi:hypothetical protein
LNNICRLYTQYSNESSIEEALTKTAKFDNVNMPILVSCIVI